MLAVKFILFAYPATSSFVTPLISFTYCTIFIKLLLKIDEPIVMPFIANSFWMISMFFSGVLIACWIGM